MQVYRGLDIGTAKPSAAERARARHHLIDVAELTEAFDAAKFVELAREAMSAIAACGKLAVLCGGTGLYFKAFLEGLGASPPAVQELRAELERLPLADLLRELSERDPMTFERIDRQNSRRVIRAVEVIRLTGKPFSQQRASWSKGPVPAVQGQGRFHMIGLSRAAEDLRRRIADRVDSMFRRGLVAETEALLRRGLADNKTALQALGYRQVAEYLRGVRSLPETVELVKIRTRQYAKRQMTWFRGQLPLQWVRIEAGESASSVVQRVRRELNRSPLQK
jgi:tRNA dimethylallyltransferase